MSFGASCLSRPSLFPRRPAGEPWGKAELTIALPGGPYLFRGLEKTQEALIRKMFGPRLVAEHHPGEVVETRVFRVDRDDFLDFEQVDWNILIDVDYRPEGLRLAAHQWMGRLEWVTASSGALWTPLTDGRAFTDLFENYFRVLVAYRLLRQGGLLVHSAAAADVSGGYIFPGASGDGKSTLSKINLREGRQVLSDDANALFVAPDRRGTPRVFVQALPFGGELRDREQPLQPFLVRSVVALRKGPANGLETLSRARAVALLAGCTPFVNGDPHRQDELLKTIDSLLAATTCRRLTFTRDGGFWNLIRHDLDRESLAAHQTPRNRR